MCHAAQGDKGASDYTSEEIAGIRLSEARTAAEIAGAEHATLGIPDMEILAADRDQLRLVIDLVREVRPDLIITHHPDDYHSDHVAISKLVFSASYAATSPLIPTDKPHYPVVTPLYYMETISGLGFSPVEFVDTSDFIDTKIAMLEAHGSQMKWVKEYHGVDFIAMARTSGAYRGDQCGVACAEAFVPNLRGFAVVLAGCFRDPSIVGDQTKIVQARTTVVAVPQRRAYMSSWRRSYVGTSPLKAVLVEVETEDGLVGIGESPVVYAGRPEVTVALIDAVIPLIIGANAFDHEVLRHQIYAETGMAHFGTRGISWALSGLDMALWDLWAGR